MASDTNIARLSALVFGAITPPPGKARITLAFAFGLVVHFVFVVAVLAMYFGISESLGRVFCPYTALANAILIIQLPLVHSLLLTAPGMRLIAKLVPGPHGGTLGTTTYAIIASFQFFALFALWTPSGIVWWEEDGWALWIVTGAYALTWLLLLKASWDAAAAVQAGALGWMSLMKNVKPRFRRDADHGSLSGDPPTDLRCLCTDALGGASLDAGSTRFGNDVDGQLPDRAKAEGTPLRATIRRSVPQVPKESSLRDPQIENSFHPQT